MIFKKILVKNFRSIKAQQINLSKITIFYGPNNTGKSSVLYAPIILKNFILNPYQKFQNIFNLNFINFGSYEQVVFNHQKDLPIEIKITFTNNLEYGIILSPKSSKISLHWNLIDETQKISDKKKITIDEKYPLNFPIKLTFQPFKIKYANSENKDLILSWNGFNIVSDNQTKSNIPNEVSEIVKTINQKISLIKSIDLIQLQRGFSKAEYSPVKTTPFLSTEDEIATILLADNGFIQGKISFYTEYIFNKIFKTFIPLNSSNFYLRIIDKQNFGFETDLINEGFGINQIIYILTKLLTPNNKLIFIEQPEVHLHPETQIKVLEVFSQIAVKENKQIAFSTHSDIFVSYMLQLVRQNKININDVKCYLVLKKANETIFTEQKIYKNGTIEGDIVFYLKHRKENFCS